MVDLPALFTALRDIRYNGLFEIELEEPEIEAAASETGEFLTRLCNQMAAGTTDAGSAGAGSA